MSDNRIETQLAELAKLEPNWNSYGSEPITEYAIVEARRLLGRLPKADQDSCWIVPDTDGGLRLEWRSPTVSEFTYFIPPAEGDTWEAYMETVTAPDLGALLEMVR